MNPTILTMPGINNSGPAHWQTLWEHQFPSFRRIQVEDWDNPVCDAWTDAIERTVQQSSGPIILVAHSLGCLTVADWAMRKQTQKVIGGLFVAVPDPHGPNFPTEAVGFSAPRLHPLPFKSIVVSSDNDPYGPPEFARRYAAAWGSKLVDVGPLGHINASSNLGRWESGLELLWTLRK